MNAENTLNYINSIMTSEESYRVLLDMISDMELELMDVSAA
jgi:hypothetical protein